ncbi:uncharacterized protein LOC141649779 [Silene latifolia]|uniref:uncharacterized protein LOC141649779 n=1 Tax=Silene latifolia TaxID=37657 RepID=UPI003D77E6D0
MNLLSLNCRGQGNPDAVGGLRNLIRRETPALVFLCETKLSSVEFALVMASFDEYSSMSVDSMGRSGGLAFLWKKDIHVTFRSAYVHFMDFDIRVDEQDWRCTGFYGWPAVPGPSPVLVAVTGGTRAQWQMNNFRDAVDVCELSDLDVEGYAFTFDNGQAGEDNRKCRLDRAMKNEGWRELFPYAKIWVGEEGCEDTIRRAWEESDWDVVDTISRCARELQKWKGLSIGKIMRDINRKRKRLEWLNVNERSVSNVRERKVVMRELNDLLKQEEIFWQQRSRALWLKEGDRNTKYFHRKAGQRKKKNRICRVTDEEGRVITGERGIKAAAVKHFKSLCTSSKPAGFSELLVGVRDRVTGAMNEVFGGEYRGEEVFEALQQMHPLKALGPDGMNALFYQTYWHIVGPSVTRLVLRILNGGEFPAVINKTHIVLIPKKKAPDRFVDYRPISLCNVLYKLVAKVLANRLKIFLGDLVSENQSAFTPGRLISDNILVAFEMFHYMKNARSGGGAYGSKA